MFQNVAFHQFSLTLFSWYAWVSMCVSACVCTHKHHSTHHTAVSLSPPVLCIYQWEPAVQKVRQWVKHWWFPCCVPALLVTRGQTGQLLFIPTSSDETGIGQGGCVMCWLHCNVADKCCDSVCSLLYHISCVSCSFWQRSCKLEVKAGVSCLNFRCKRAQP